MSIQSIYAQTNWPSSGLFTCHQQIFEKHVLWDSSWCFLCHKIAMLQTGYGKCAVRKFPGWLLWLLILRGLRALLDPLNPSLNTYNFNFNFILLYLSNNSNTNEYKFVLNKNSYYDREPSQKCHYVHSSLSLKCTALPLMSIELNGSYYQHVTCPLGQVFAMHIVSNALPIHFIELQVI